MLSLILPIALPVQRQHGHSRVERDLPVGGYIQRGEPRASVLGLQHANTSLGSSLARVPCSRLTLELTEGLNSQSLHEWWRLRAGIL